MRKVAPRPYYLVLPMILSAGLLTSCNAPFKAAPTDSSAIKNVNDTKLVVADSMNDRVLIYSAPYSTQESASLVLGQPDFTAGMVSGPSPASQGGLKGPIGVTADAAGNLYVADTGNCRVLKFAPPFSSGMNAALVLGQPDMATSCSSQDQVGAQGMLTPGWITFDAQGNLWVSDAAADRITEYEPPFTNGMAATLAIGQNSLQSTRNSCNGAPSLIGGTPSDTTLCQPWGISFDTRGDLWVVDSGNSRILEYQPPFSTGMAATLEIGQPVATEFSSSAGCSTGPTATSMCQPRALAFDAGGNLWVTDSEDWRVLEFTPPFSSGMAASTVLGQPDFVHRNESPGNAGPNTVGFPTGLAFDSSGNLIVGDPEAYRVVVFAPPFSNGMNATTVLGQPGLTSTASTVPAANATTLALPDGILAF